MLQHELKLQNWQAKANLNLVRQQEAKLEQLKAEQHRLENKAHSGTQADPQIQKTQEQFKAARGRQRANAAPVSSTSAASAPAPSKKGGGKNPVIQLERFSTLVPPLK